MNKGVNVIALVKGSERYIFLYDDESAPKMLQTLGKYAGDPDLSFSWYDAAVLSQKVRKLKRDRAHDENRRPPFPGHESQTAVRLNMRNVETGGAIEHLVLHRVGLPVERSHRECR